MALLGKANAAAAIGHVPFARIVQRKLHKGHVGATLEKLNLPRHHWLKEVEQAPEKSSVRRMKDRYFRELGQVHGQLQSLFGAEEQSAIKERTQEERVKLATAQEERELNNEALRAYRMLRPDAAPFYEEDAMLGMKAKMNKITMEDKAEDGLAHANLADPFKAYLPVVNQKAFVLALEAITASLAEDLEVLCRLANIEDLPAENDPLRFHRLVDKLFDFKLKKDPAEAKEWVENHWDLLEKLLPKEVALLERKKVSDWLQGHLERVLLNQKRYEEADQKIFLHKERSKAVWYSFAEDFPYDDDPLPGLLADERNLDFPLEKAQEFMELFLGMLSKSKSASEVHETLAPGVFEHEDTKTVGDQFQDFVWALEEIGLRNWLKMDLDELERHLPKDNLEPLVLGTSENAQAQDLILGEDDVEVAKLMLKCASRGKADLLDFEAVDPYKLLHGMPTREVEEELGDLPKNAYLSDMDLEEIVSAHCARLQTQRPEVKWWAEQQNDWLKGSAKVSDLYQKELEFYRTAGPVEWEEGKDGGYQWKWRQPANTFWDQRRRVYVQEQKGVDPNLDLKELRQHMLAISRMRSMCSVGKVTYFRGIVVVGNGRGIYGIGIGFGSTPKECRADSTLKALQNLDYIDYDPGRMFCTPCKGQEYKHTMTLVPRPIGRGLKANKKFLPLLYILGLDNCKVKFMFKKWFTRIRAVKRCLDQVISRRTLANMTGKRYALLVAPGDHWVHWPDRWFDVTSEPYKAQDSMRKLMRKHALHFKKRGAKFAIPTDVQPGWRKKNWARWNNALERWTQHQRENYEPFDSASKAGTAISTKLASYGLSPR